MPRIANHLGNMNSKPRSPLFDDSLIAKAKSGDAASLQELLDAFAPFIKKHARWIARSLSIERDDASSLLKCTCISSLEGYDRAKSRLPHFWKTQCRYAVTEHARGLDRDSSWRDRFGKLANWMDDHHGLYDLYESPPLKDVVEIADNVDLPACAVRRLLARSSPAALSHYLRANESRRGTNVADQVDQADTLEKIEQGLALLSDRERTVVEHYFGLGGREPISFAKIGRLMGGLSSSRTHQILSAAIQRIRDSAGVGAQAAMP